MELRKYSLVIYNKHILLNNGEGNILVDTGSPMSFHCNGHIDIEDLHINVPTSCMNINNSFLSEKIGCEISGILGMDIINQLQLWIDIKNNIFIVENKSSSIPSCTPIRTFSIMGVPGIEVFVNQRKARLLFDTGAPISYISNSFTAGTTVVDSVQDFSPLIGGDSYVVERHSLTTNFADKDFKVLYANAPVMISTLLNMYNVDGIIGYDLLEKFRFIIKGGVLYLPPQGI